MSPVVGKGHKTYLQYGPQVAWGTAVAATKRIEVHNVSLTKKDNAGQDPSIYNQLSPIADYEGPICYELKFTTRLQYEALGMLFQSLQGTAVFNTNDAGVTTGPTGSIYVHTLIDREYPRALTGELIEGNIPAGKGIQLKDGVVTDCVIKIQAGRGEQAYVMADWTMLFTEATTNFTFTVIGAVTELPVMYYHIDTANSQDGSGDTQSTSVRMQSVEITLKNQGDDSRLYLGSQSHDQPITDNWRRPNWKITQEYITKTAFDAERALTATNPKIRFLRPSTLQAISFSSGACKPKVSKPVQGFGRIIQTVEHSARYFASDASSIKIVIENSSSAIDL